MSYSSANPKPPYVCTATFAASHDASAASSFAMFASVAHGRPASNSSAARNRIRSAGSTLTCARAIGNWTPWFCPIGRLNTTRSFAYRVARSTNQRPDRQTAADRAPQIDEQHRQSFRALAHLFEWRGARDEQEEVRVLRTGDE